MLSNSAVVNIKIYHPFKLKKLLCQKKSIIIFSKVHNNYLCYVRLSCQQNAVCRWYLVSKVHRKGNTPTIFGKWLLGGRAVASRIKLRPGGGMLIYKCRRSAIGRSRCHRSAPAGGRPIFGRNINCSLLFTITTCVQMRMFVRERARHQLQGKMYRKGASEQRRRG